MTGQSRALFRESVLRRYAAGGVPDESLHDASPRLLASLWVCAGLLVSGLLALMVLAASLLR